MGLQDAATSAIPTSGSGSEASLADRTPARPDDVPLPLPASDRVEFRTWTPADFPLALGLWGDPEVTRYMARGPHDAAAVRARLEREADALRRFGFQYWPLFLREQGTFVGCCGLKPCPYEGSPEAPELELGFHLAPAMWGRGLATEAATAVARWAFDHLVVARLYAGHHPENRASERVLRKLGFEYARDVHFEPTGLMHPLYVLERRP